MDKRKMQTKLAKATPESTMLDSKSQVLVDREATCSLVWATGRFAPDWNDWRDMAIDAGTSAAIIPTAIPENAVGAGMIVDKSGDIYPFVAVKDSRAVTGVLLCVPVSYPAHIRETFVAPDRANAVRATVAVKSPQPSPVSVPKTEEIVKKGADKAMLKIFHEGSEVVIQTDAADEREFNEAWAVAIAEMIVEMKFDSQEEWESFLREASTQYAHLICHFRGYKAPQVEVRQIATTGSRYLMDKTTPIVSTGQQRVHVGASEGDE